MAADGDPAEDTLTPLDWGVSGFLHLIKLDVVEKQIEEWGRVLTEAEAALTQQRKAFIFNLASALHEAHSLFSEHGPGSRWLSLSDISVLDDVHVLNNVINTIRGELKQRENRYPRLLFNSYYYVAFSQYGQRGEYYFVPLSLPLPGVSEEIRVGFQDYLKEAQTPHRVAPGRADQYRTTILPAYGGVTPQLCRLALLGDTKPTVIDWFLADIAIIGKTEDHINRHRSALIAPIVCRDRPRDAPHCEGALVLTCSLPCGFNPPLHFGKDDVKATDECERVVKTWAAAPLYHLHRSLRRESRGPQTRVIWESLERSGLKTAPLSAILKSELLKFGPDGVIALAGCANRPARDVQFSALNPDALGHAVRTIMCPGPMLAPRVLCAGLPNKTLLVDPERAKSHFALLQDFSYPLSQGDDDIGTRQENCRAAAALLFQCLKGFPGPTLGEQTTGASTDADFGLVTLGDKNLRLVVITQTPSKLVEVRQLGRRVLESLNEGIRGEHPLPDETSPFFALLQQHWTERHDLGLNVAAAAGIGNAYDRFEKLVDHESVHSAFAFLSTEQFVPEIQDNSKGSGKIRAELRDACLQYPAYWLLEGICKLMTRGTLPIERFGEGTLKYPAKFVDADGSQFPKVVVKLSKDPDLNDKWISALTYFGIPVEYWATGRRPITLADTQVIEIESSAGPLDEYREFLVRLLRQGSRVAAISRAFAPAPGSTPNVDFAIDTIDVTPHIGSDGTHVSFQLKFRALSEPLRLEWRPVATAELVLFGVNTKSVLEQLAVSAAERDSSLEQWSSADGRMLLPPIRAIDSTIENLRNSLIQATEASLAGQQLSARHNSIELPKTTLELAKNMDDILKANAYEGTLPTLLKNAWRRPRWIDKKTARNARSSKTAAEMAARLFVLSSLTALDSREADDRYDLFGFETKTVPAAINLCFELAIAKGVREGVNSLGLEGYTIGESKVDWIEYITKQFTRRIRYTDLAALKFPSMQADDKSRRRRMAVVLITAFAGAIKHHIRFLTDQFVDHEHATPPSARHASANAANAYFSILCQRDRIRVENYAGPAGASSQIPKKTGTYRDLDLNLSITPVLGKIANWGIENRGFDAVFVTELALLGGFWN